MLIESLTVGRGRALSLIILGVLTTFGPMAIDLYLPAFPDVAVDLGVPVTTVPLTLTTSMIGMGVGQLLYGPLSDRYGRKKPLVGGLVLFTVASVACALAPTFQTLLGFRFLQSLGGAAGVVIARAIVRDLYQGRELAKALSIVVMVFGLAPVLAPTLGAVLLEFGGWRTLFYFLSMFGIGCIAISAGLPETHAANRRNDHGIVLAIRTYASLSKDSRFLAPALLIGFSYVTLFGFISTAPAILMDYFGLDELMFAILFGFLSLCFAIGAPINRRLLRNFSIQRLIMGAVVLQVVSAAGLFASGLGGPRLIVFVLTVGVAMLTVAVVSANGTALALDPFPNSAGSAAALVGLVGMAFGASVSALLVALHSPVVIELAATMLVGGIAGLVMLPFIAGSRRNRGIPVMRVAANT
ncbi:MAG: multidrug effflux MFS transporter [Actinomycetota bacterium]|nr:multidrug effflux MFS transporter [Actinomycetota bacterium]